VLGKLHALRGQHREAFEAFEQALAEMEKGEARYELAVTYLDYANARLARGRRGDQGKAAALLHEAELAFSQLGLPLPAADISIASGDGAGGRRFGLTAREVEILRLVAQGMSNGKVAEQLRITVFTVARHLESIRRKTGAANRTEAVEIAGAEGIIPRRSGSAS
jgi:DNA-binding CsgD family transcriptional regulator